MDHVHMWGWYYQGGQGERAAKHGNEKLFYHRLVYPFHEPYEAALLRVGVDEHWSVGIHVGSENKLVIQRQVLEE